MVIICLRGMAPPHSGLTFAVILTVLQSLVCQKSVFLNVAKSHAYGGYGHVGHADSLVEFS